MKRYAFLIFLLSPLFLFAQNNFVEGRIVNKQLDTLHGMINDQKWKINPSIIEFKENSSSKIQNFTPSDIISFHLDVADYYSKSVEIDTLPRQDQKLGKKKKPQFKEDQLFLKKLVDGETPLYQFRDKENKQHFFVDIGGEVIELIFIRYRNSLNLIREKNTFKGQLNFLLNDCSQMYSMISSAKYDRESLVEILETYNNCFSENDSDSKKTKRDWFKFGVIAGATLTKINFNGHNSSNTEYLTFNPALNYSAGVSFDFLFPNRYERLTIRNEVILKPYKQTAQATIVIEGDQWYEELDSRLDFTQVKVHTLVQWKIKDIENTFFVTGGLVNSFAVKKNNNTHLTNYFYSSITEEDEPPILFFKDYDFGFVGGLGYAYDDFIFDAKYEFGNGITKEFGLASKTHTIYLSMKYYL